MVWLVRIQKNQIKSAHALTNMGMMDTPVTLQHDGGRVEDFRLITGTGKYASDWSEPGQLYGHFVRADASAPAHTQEF